MKQGVTAFIAAVKRLSESATNERDWNFDRIVGISTDRRFQSVNKKLL
jgi:hypothetical protein